MEDMLINVGKIAGVGGISLAVLLVIYRQLLRKNIFPMLTKNHSFRIIFTLLFLTAGVVVIGLLCWTYISYTDMQEQSISAFDTWRNERLQYVKREDPLRMKLMPLSGFSGTPGSTLYIRTLPEDRKYLYKKAQAFCDSSVTNEMNEGNYIVIDFLINNLCVLSQRYPEGHFTYGDLRTYYERMVLERYDFHRQKYNSDGTMYSLIAGIDVITELENMVSEMVGVILLDEDDFDYEEWKIRWTEDFWKTQ